MRGRSGLLADASGRGYVCIYICVHVRVYICIYVYVYAYIM